ncbi:MAG: NifU family protein [Christensenellaceae bacterium]
MTKQEIQNYIDSHVSCQNADIEVESYKNGILNVALRGACKGCPGADDTIKELLEGTLMTEYPEIEEVIVDQSVSDELIQFAKKLLSKDGK